MAALSEDIFTESINVFERRIKFIMSDIDKILREKKEAETAAPKGDTPAEDITTKKKREEDQSVVVDKKEEAIRALLPRLQASQDPTVQKIMHFTFRDYVIYHAYDKHTFVQTKEMNDALEWRHYLLNKINTYKYFYKFINKEEAKYIDVARDFNNGSDDEGESYLPYDRENQRDKKKKMILYFFTPEQIEHAGSIQGVNFSKFDISEFQTDDQKRSFIEYKATMDQLGAFFTSLELFYKYGGSRNIQEILPQIGRIDYKQFATEKQREIFKSLIYEKATVDQIQHLSEETLDWLYSGRSGFNRERADGTIDRTVYEAYMNLLYSKPTLVYRHADEANIYRALEILLILDYENFNHKQRAFLKSVIYKKATIEQIKTLPDKILDWLSSERKEFIRKKKKLTFLEAYVERMNERGKSGGKTKRNGSLNAKRMTKKNRTS